MVQFPITTLINAGNWTISGGKPIIKEFYPHGDDGETGIDPNFRYLLKFKRILIIQLVDQERDHLGFSKTHEKVDSQDMYDITIKSGSYSDSKDILDNLREILLSQPTSGDYSHFEFGEMEPAPSRGKWAYNTRINAHYAGKVRDTG